MLPFQAALEYNCGPDAFMDFTAPEIVAALEYIVGWRKGEIWMQKNASPR